MTTQRHDFDARPFTVEELPWRPRLALRVRPGNRAALAGALALDLPASVGLRARAEGAEVLCLGPDEWVVLADADAPRAAALVAASGEAHARIPHSLVEISDREVTLRLSGPQALTALTTACPRDVEAMPVGQGARTLFDTATVTLWRDDRQEFRMDVWRSFLPHVRAILGQVTTELRSGL